MPGEDYQSWSATAADNGTADALIDWHEGQTRASVNNSSRSEMAAHAKNRNLLNGSIVTTGSANAQQFLSGVGYTSIPTGLIAKLKVGAGLTNTLSMTLNMDGLGDTLVKLSNGDNLMGGEFPANCYVDVLYNGTNWIFLYSHEFFWNRLTGGGGIIIGQQLFTTPGSFTYTPSAGMECCIIECIGGGGGGAAAYTGGVGTESFQGGGGGSGGYSRSLRTAAQVGGPSLVTVGAGGAAGNSSYSIGIGGTASSVGSLCVANGGGGGFHALNGVNPVGGNGGATGTGDFTSAGTPGGWGMYGGAYGGNYVLSGNGAPGPFGGGAVTTVASAGANATGYGAGGSGGHAHNASTTGYVAGGAGAPGAVIITEFAGRGAPGRDGVTGAPGPIGPAGPAGSGTGDVLVSGTPVAGQIARWTDASHIQGVTSSGFITSIVVQKFTANSIYTPTTGMTYCSIEAVGGGGGGGAAGFFTGHIYAAGGGGAGGYSRAIKTAAQIGVSQTVTIGSGGNGGTTGSPGIDGTDTSVGALVIAKGGKGGAGAAGGTFSVGGAGGIAGTGDITAAGAPGGPGLHNASNTTIHSAGGFGGSSFFGGGAAGSSGDAAGAAAGNYGGGGAGGHAISAVRNGGAGSAGIVVITEYIAA